MKDTMLKPCADWIEKLAVRHSDDLAYDDRIALNKHLTSCRACASIHTFYQEIGVRICSLPAVEPLPDLPYEISQLERNSAIRKGQPASLFSGLLTWLSVPERLLNAILARLTQKVIYASSSDHYIYALGDNSSSLLWKYKKSDAFFSTPAVKNKVTNLTSFDAQIFLFETMLRLGPTSGSLLWKN